MTTRVGKRIVSNPNVRFGKPVIEGTRIDVATIVGAVAGGWTLEQVASEYDIPLEAVKAALAYAADVLENYKPDAETSK